MNDLLAPVERKALESVTSKGRTGPVILIVDDDEPNRRLLSVFLQAEGYETREAESGRQALSSVIANLPDLILLDVMMPDIDGYSVVAKLKSVAGTKAIPVILVTALAGREARVRGLEAGAEEFLTKPIELIELMVRVRNLLRLKQLSDTLRDQNQLLEARVQERTAELRQSHIETIVTLARAAELKDPETAAHIQRLSHYTKELALYLGEGAELAEDMFHASPMHDVGKIGVPDHVLLKKSGLTALEWGVMKSHTTIGWEILRRGTTRYMQLGRRSPFRTMSAGMAAATRTSGLASRFRSRRGCSISAINMTRYGRSDRTRTLLAMPSPSRSSRKAMGALRPITSIRDCSSRSRRSRRGSRRSLPLSPKGERGCFRGCF